MPTAKIPPQVSIPIKKPTLVLVHGFRGAPIGLEEIAQVLRRHGYLVHAPAISPFAGAKKLSDYTPKQYAKFLRDYIHQQKLDHPVLIGHSMGSIVVSATVDQYPDLLHKKVVLLSPISKRTAAPFRVISPLSALLPRPAVDYITTKYLFVPRDNELLQQVLEITRQCSSNNPPSSHDMLGATKFSTNYAVPDFAAHGKDFYLLAGEKDRLISQKDTQALAQNIQAQVDFLPGCGHLHNYEKPQETALKIIEFLEK